MHTFAKGDIIEADVGNTTVTGRIADAMLDVDAITPGVMVLITESDSMFYSVGKNVLIPVANIRMAENVQQCAH